MKRKTVSRSTVWLAAGFVLAAIILGPAVSAEEREVRFKVSHPFRVGEHVFDAGVIAISSVSAYTPSVALLKVWVNNECLGMITAHRSVTDVSPVRTEALFRRDDDGFLVMVGYRVTGHPTGTTYRFAESQEAAALTSAHTDLASTSSPHTARLDASASGSVSTVSTSSASRRERVGTRSSAR